MPAGQPLGLLNTTSLYPHNKRRNHDLVPLLAPLPRPRLGYPASEPIVATLGFHVFQQISVATSLVPVLLLKSFHPPPALLYYHLIARSYSGSQSAGVYNITCPDVGVEGLDIGDGMLPTLCGMFNRWSWPWR